MTAQTPRRCAARPALRPVRQAAAAHHPVRDGGGNLIYVPSIANFRLNWLNDRLAAAHTAALVLDAAPKGMVPESWQADSRQHRRQGSGDEEGQPAAAARRRQHAVAIAQDIDMRDVRWWRAIVDAFDTLYLTAKRRDPRGRPGADGDGEFLEIVLDEPPLRKAMLTLLGQHPAAVAGDLRHRRDAGFPRAALPVGAADAAHHRQHDDVPRRSGKPCPHHRNTALEDRIQHRIGARMFGVALRFCSALESAQHALIARRWGGPSRAAAADSKNVAYVRRSAGRTPRREQNPRRVMKTARKERPPRSEGGGGWAAGRQTTRHERSNPSTPAATGTLPRPGGWSSVVSSPITGAPGRWRGCVGSGPYSEPKSSAIPPIGVDRDRPPGLTAAVL